jgi:hypothetical protein
MAAPKRARLSCRSVGLRISDGPYQPRHSERRYRGRVIKTSLTKTSSYSFFRWLRRASLAVSNFSRLLRRRHCKSNRKPKRLFALRFLLNKFPVTCGLSVYLEDLPFQPLSGDRRDVALWAHCFSYCGAAICPEFRSKRKWLTHARYDVIDSLQALDAVAIGGVYLVRITPD